MGNQNSKAESGGSSVTTSQDLSHGQPPPNNVQSRKHARRRESIQTPSTLLSTAAPPSASLENATGQNQSSSPQQTRTNLPAHSRTRSRTITVAEMGNEHSRQKSRDTAASSSARASPAPTSVAISKHSEVPPVDTSGPPEDHVYFSPPQYIRPPRLPLPIEKEPVVAGSPIISPADLVTPVEPGDLDGEIPRKTSLLSSVTGDEDYPPDEPHLAVSDRPAIPTLVEWDQGGHKVYVTGTFTNWDKKYRLHRDPKSEKDVLSSMIPIPPGTHHLKFIVDNEMRTSDKMPTAVDDYGILVNYLEVIPEAPPSTQPIDIPGGERRAPPGVYPPQLLPPTPEIKPSTSPVPPQKPGGQVSKQPAKIYYREIPQYLLDVEYFNGEEDSPQHLRGQAAADSQPAPPTLPGFLGKSILNATQQIKDDASVLIYPNHTVLNHLGTSSIKNGVIATSATTRYKRKYVTTILHKPVSDAD